MRTALVYAIIIPLVVLGFGATALLIWDMWHIPVIYVDEAE